MATPSRHGRLKHVRALWRHQIWTRWVGIVWAALGVFTFLRDDIFEPTDEQRWRIINLIPHLPLVWWLCGLAVIIGYGIFEASFRLSRELHNEIAALTDNRKSVRVELARFCQKGQLLMAKCLELGSAPPIIDANDWARDVEIFLHNKLDESYVVRFKDRSNAMDVRPVGAFNEESIAVWRAPRIWVMHMNEFIKEFST
jgi:hypothetical protein